MVEPFRTVSYRVPEVCAEMAICQPLELWQEIAVVFFQANADVPAKTVIAAAPPAIQAARRICLRANMRCPFSV